MHAGKKIEYSSIKNSLTSCEFCLVCTVKMTAAVCSTNERRRILTVRVNRLRNLATERQLSSQSTVKLSLPIVAVEYRPHLHPTADRMVTQHTIKCITHRMVTYVARNVHRLKYSL